MNFSPRPSLRRAAVGITAILAVGGLVLAPTADAIAPTETERLEGADRYETAVAVAADTFPDGATSVILATGQRFADALAASGMAGALDAPVLLTLTDQLLDVTADALTDLGAETVYLMGGEAALSQDVEDALTEADYTVERVAGEDRFGTAAAAGQVIADQADPIMGGGIGETSGGVTAFVTNGLKFPDAVSASPVAYAGNLPILLTAPDKVPQSTLTAITDLGIEHVVLVGGTGVISTAVREKIESETEVTTERVAGKDRWETNLDVVQFGIDQFEIGGETVYLSTGMEFADALVGGPAAGQNLNRLLLLHPDVVPEPTETYLADNAGQIDHLIAIGGTAAIADGTLATAGELAVLDNNEAFEVSPSDSEQKEQSGSPLTDEGRRLFEATGLAAETTYVIAVFDSAVVGSQGGDVTVSAQGEDQLANGPSTAIETINGSQNTSGGPAGSGTETVQVTADSNADGVLSFSIDATDPDSVIPFVYLDENGNGELDLVENLPDEPFGIGGLTEWIGAEAAAGNYAGDDSVTVQEVSRAGNFFTTSEGVFHYSSGDLYEADTDDDDALENIDFDQFEGLITAGDELEIEYFQDDQSIFSVIGDNVPDISDVTASSTQVAAGGDEVEVSWLPSDQQDTEYQVYLDADRDGELQTGEPTRGALVTDNGSSATFTETTAEGTAQYIVVPTAGTTGVEDSPDDPDGSGPSSAPPNFVSNEIPVGWGMIGLSQGTTVSTNAGNSAANEGDVWMLSFSKDVAVSSSASITITAGGDDFTYQNGTTRSTWEADGSTVVITLGSAATSTDTFTYSGAEVTDLSGVTDLGNTGADEADLLDTTLENNGPDLMPESTTCNEGDSTCTIRFNEPVGAGTAESPGSYGRDHETPNTLNSVSLAEDGRTITLSFGNALSEIDEIRPATALAAVEDDDGQAASQALFDFVLPTVP